MSNPQPLQHVTLILFFFFCVPVMRGFAQIFVPPAVLSAIAQTSDRQESLGTPLDPLLTGAKSLLEKGSVTEADRMVRQYLDQHPSSADGHFLLGLILFREIQATASLEHKPVNSGDLPFNAVDSHFKEAKAKASLAEFTEGAKYRKPSASDLKIVALDYVLLADYEDADKWLTLALKWNPSDADGWYYLGRTKYNEDRFEEALQAFEQCLKLDPKNVKAEVNLGLSYVGLNRNAEAIVAYQTAIFWQAQLPRKNPEPYIDLGSLLIEQNRSEEAISYLLQAIQIDAHESSAHEKLGKAYTDLNQLQKAQTEYETAIALSPEAANLHYLLGQIYRKEGFVEKAKTEFARYDSLKNNSPSPK